MPKASQTGTEMKETDMTVYDIQHHIYELIQWQAASGPV